MLPSRRRELHALVAQTIADKFTSIAEAQPQVVANHWTEAGVFEKAIPLWVEAGKAAVSRHAFEEAADDLRSGHRLLANLPETPERDAQEIEISFALRRVLYTLSGYRGQEVRSLIGPERRDCRKHGRYQASYSVDVFVIRRALYGQ